MDIIQDQILVRRDTLANWQASNPTLGDGELGWVSDTRDLVAGPGTFSDVWTAAQAIPNRAKASADAASGSATSAATSAALATNAAVTALAPATTSQRRAGLVVIGDSITAYNVNVGNAWHKVITGLAGKIRHRGAFATGGYTLEQIETTHLPSVLAMNPLPGACIIAGGTNNLGAGASFNPTASRATLNRIIDALQLVGVMPVLWCPPPRDDSTAVNASTQRWNAYIRYLAQRRGLPYVDAYAALVDPTTGKYQAALKLDDVHPNNIGHLRIGQRMAADPEFLRRFNNDTPHLSLDVLDAANLIPTGQGLFNQGVNGANNPTGWAAYGGNNASYTMQQVAATAPAVGNWQVMKQASGAATQNAGLQYQATSGFAPGDTIVAAARVWSATAESGAMGAASLEIMALSDSAVLGQTDIGGFGGTWEGIFWQEMKLPAGTTRVRLNLMYNTSTSPTADSSVQFAQATMSNLTALQTAS